MYRIHCGRGALGSGVGWVRGRPPAGSWCRGPTVGGSSLVSPWCVPWWPLVGWLWRVFAVYRIHGGTTVCWQAAVGVAPGCWGVACFGVACGVCGGGLCVVLGGYLGGLLCVGGGLGLGSSWDGAGHAGSKWLRVRARACLPSAPSAVFSSVLHLFLCFCLFGFPDFLTRGCVWSGHGCGCVPVLMLPWTSWRGRPVVAAVSGAGVPGDGGWAAVALLVPCVCVGSGASGGTGHGGAGGRRSAAVVVWCPCGWSWLSSSA